MTSQAHHDFIHFAMCMRKLNDAWATLHAVRESGDGPLIGPAFRFALVEYATPYTASYDLAKKRYILDNRYVPSDLVELHKRIVDARHTVHAHADMSVADAKLYVTVTQGRPSAQISSNYIHGLEELPNIEEIIRLVEGTLDNMYGDQESRLAALQP